jgi:hypothetical protein
MPHNLSFRQASLVDFYQSLEAALIVVVNYNFICSETFATSGHVLARNPHLVTPEDSLKIAKETALRWERLKRRGRHSVMTIIVCRLIQLLNNCKTLYTSKLALKEI